MELVRKKTLRGGTVLVSQLAFTSSMLRILRTYNDRGGETGAWIHRENLASDAAKRTVEVFPDGSRFRHYT